MTASVPIVRLENVSRDFDDGAVVALCDVSLSTYANDCVAILGKSGSGKSTLIHVLSGCDEVTSGRVYWREEPVRDHVAKAAREPDRHRISGILFVANIDRDGKCRIGDPRSDRAAGKPDGESGRCKGFQNHLETRKAFLSAHPFIHYLFHPRRPRMKTSNHRVARAKALKIWAKETSITKQRDPRRN